MQRAERETGDLDRLGEQHGTDRGGKGGDGSDRKIDAAGQDDEGLADRKNGGEGGLAEDVQRIAGGEEVGRREGEEDDEEDERDERPAAEEELLKILPAVAGRAARFGGWRRGLVFGGFLDHVVPIS
jgi:hypothetical protein